MTHAIPCHNVSLQIKNAPARVFNGLRRRANAPVPARRQEHGQDAKSNIFCQAAELQQTVFQYQEGKIEALCPLQMFLRALQWLKQAITQELEM